MRFSATLVLFTLLAGTASAQWLYRDPDAPRTAGGTVDGKAPAPRTASGNLDLSGIWQTDVKDNANLAVDLKAGDVVMLPWGQALYDERQGNNGKDDRGPLSSAGRAARERRAVSTEDHPDAGRDVILNETRTTFRQIFLEGHTLVSDPQPTWMGYSRGRWEGDTLVVETTGFNDRTWLDDAGHPHSDQMKVTERFRRPAFGQLFVDITIDDPKVYAKPWSVTQEFQLIADGELIEYVCNENNLDVPHLVGSSIQRGGELLRDSTDARMCSKRASLRRLTSRGLFRNHAVRSSPKRTARSSHSKALDVSPITA